MRPNILPALFLFAFLLQGCLTPKPEQIVFSGKDVTAQVRLKEIQGNAQVLTNAGGAWIDADEDAQLSAGARIRTRSNSKLTIVIPDDHSKLLVGPDSEVEIVAIEKPLAGDTTALEVQIRVIDGSATGVFRGGQTPSTFIVSGPDGRGSSYSPNPGQTMNVSISIMPQPTIGLGPPDYGSFYNHPSYLRLPIVPEPSPAQLAGLGLAALFVFRRFRRKKPH